MLDIRNLDNVQEAGDWFSPEPGGYIATIVSVENVAEKQYIKLNLDIADGDFIGYYKDLYDKKGFWGLNAIRSYKEKALPFFKAFIIAVAGSNAGFVWNNEEQDLVGKQVGIVLGEEEYRKNNGDVGNRLVVDKFLSVIQIEKEDYRIPPKKTLAGGAPQQGGAVASYAAGSPDDFAVIDDSEDLPF